MENVIKLDQGTIEILTSALSEKMISKIKDMEQYAAINYKAGLTLDEASLYTGIGRKSLEKIIYQNSVPFSKVGSKTIVFKKHLDDLLAVGIDLWANGLHKDDNLRKV